jgi:sugar phosphate isomerase/epimerase
MMKRGLKARPHDLARVMEMKPEMVEFHADAADLDKNIEGQHDVQMALHVPEYDGQTLLDLSSDDPMLRAQAVRLTDKALATARRWAEQFRGTPKVVVHPGAWSSEPLPKTAKLGLYDNFAASVRELNLNGVDFLVENMPPHPWFYGGQWHCNIFMDARECRDFCSGNAIGLCFDVCHAFLYCNSVGAKLIDFARVVRPVMAHVHFSDAKGTDGEGLQIGEGDLPLKEIIDDIGEVQVGWIGEVWQSHRDGFKEMKRIWPLIDEIMRKGNTGISDGEGQKHDAP